MVAVRSEGSHVGGSEAGVWRCRSGQLATLQADALVLAQVQAPLLPTWRLP